MASALRVGMMLFFPPTLWTRGGGERQVEETRRYLIELGVQAELFDIWRPSRDYDVIHVFGSTYHLSDFVATARSLGTPVVVSPIHSTNRPNWQWAVYRLLSKIAPTDTVFSLRNRLLHSASVLLPSSNAEAASLQRHFRLKREQMIIVPNGADPSFAEASPQLFLQKYGLSDFVLQVSRLVPGKGQLRLLRALRREDVPLVFVGDGPDSGYMRELLKEASGRKHVHFLGRLGGDMLTSAYAAASVHVLPSISESAPLVNLEAGLAGCRVVAPDLPTVREYLREHAVYCKPTSIASIRGAVLHALNSKSSDELRRHIASHYTWPIVAEKTAAAYREALMRTGPTGAPGESA